MILRIIRVEDNINYIENKSYSVVTDGSNDTALIQNNVYAVCDRAWISEEFSLKYGWEYIYKFKVANDYILEGNIIEKGIDEKGYYVLFLDNKAFMHLQDKKERSHLQCGEIEIDTILSPDMIKGSSKILEAFDKKWPSFHETCLSIVEKTSANMTLKFTEGLLFNKVVELKIKGIVSENYDKDCLESFTNDWLSSVEFRKSGDNMAVFLFHDYKISKLPEGFDTSVFNNPEFDHDILKDLYIVEEYKNHGISICKEIEMMLTIDTEKVTYEGYKGF